MIPDRWLAVTVALGEAEDASLLADVLVEWGARAVVEDPSGTLLTHFLPPADAPGFVDRLRTALGGGGGARPRVSWHWEPHERWEETWKRGLRPRRVTPRITVAPSWDVPRAHGTGALVVVDPGMAFGTAEHASTRGALRLLDPVLSGGERIVDVGAGSAILAIAAAKLGAAAVTAIEADPLACPTARDNVAGNGVDALVEVVEGRATVEWLAARGPFDGIVANIESGALTGLLPGFGQALAGEGWLVVAGILAEESALFTEAAMRVGLILDAEDLEDGWWAARFTPSG